MARPASAAFVPTILVYLSRERVRSLARAIFPRKRFRLAFVRSSEEMAATFQNFLVDAAVVDAGQADADTWRAAGLSKEFPSTAFFALLPMRPGDAGTVTRCALSGCADLLVEGVDEPVARQIVSAGAFSARFQRALQVPPPVLALASPLQLRIWAAIISHAGTPVTAAALGADAGLSREHLSRKFAEGGAPNLKRVIDLVRVIAAAELSKDPGRALRDVARVLGFVSSSHLAVTASRISGTRPVSLTRLRTVDLIDRFCRGRTRSRG